MKEQLAEFDAAVDEWFTGLRGNPTTDHAMYAASALGDFSLLWHIAGAVEALRGREREAVRLSVALGVESVLVNGVVKQFFGRRRPAWDLPRTRKLRKPRSSSFPSGHATSAFMAATLLGQDRPATTKAAWYALATVVAASRIHVKIHHASDVVVGAAIGIALGAAVARVGNETVRRGH